MAESIMIVIISVLVVVVLVGVPTFFIARAWKNAEKEAPLPPPEAIWANLRKAFFLWFWGVDLAFGSIVLMVVSAIWAAGSDEYGMLDRLPVALAVTLVPLIAGMVLLVIGRVGIGVQTRRLEHGTGRERTPLEDYVLAVMGNFEGQNVKALAIQVARVTGNKVDDVAAAAAGIGILGKIGKWGKLFTGKSFLKNHWPWLLTAALALVFVFLSLV